MSNQKKNVYGLPEDSLDEIRIRDKNCVYCHKTMVNFSDNEHRKDWATIEHLNNLPPWDNISTVAICCGSCNSSRSNKKLLDWFGTPYCIEKDINFYTVAKPVIDYIEEYEK